MKTIDFEIEGVKGEGFEFELPKAPLVGAKIGDGFVLCGYLNVETANKLGVAAAVVRGVSTVDELLSSIIQDISQEAEKKGVRPGMTGRQALGCFI